MEKLEITYINISDIVPYEGNPRKNDKAVEVVMKSIKEFGFLVPVILDDKNCIVAGHTRVKAAIRLGMSEVPCIYAEGLTNAQIKAFRIMDNKSGEYAEWDLDKLKAELNELKELNFDLDLTGFEQQALEMLEIQNIVHDVPDVELEGALKEYSKVIVIVGMNTDEHERRIRDFLELKDNQKTMKSFEFINVLNKKVKDENSNPNI